MIKTSKINNFKIQLPKAKKVDNRPVKGAFMFPKELCTTYILGKKESGKTVLIWNIIQHRIEKNTTVVIFCPTVYADHGWINILEWLENNDIPHMIHTSIYNNDGTNALKELVSELEDEAKARYDDMKESKKKKHKSDKFDVHKVLNPEEETEKKERKPKYKAADYLILIDDLSDEIGDSSLPTLIKKHRHFKTQLIISNQTLNDLPLSARKQLDYWIIFPGLDDIKLREVYDRCTLQIDFDQFQDLYYAATSKPYNFLYFCSYLNDFRRNFDEMFKITTVHEQRLKNNISKKNNPHSKYSIDE